MAPEVFVSCNDWQERKIVFVVQQELMFWTFNTYFVDRLSLLLDLSWLHLASHLYAWIVTWYLNSCCCSESQCAHIQLSPFYHLTLPLMSCTCEKIPGPPYTSRNWNDMGLGMRLHWSPRIILYSFLSQLRTHLLLSHTRQKRCVMIAQNVMQTRTGRTTHGCGTGQALSFTPYMHGPLACLSPL